jgi:hypothetical protein
VSSVQCDVGGRLLRHGVDAIEQAREERVGLGVVAGLEEETHDQQRAAVLVRVHKVRLAVEGLAVERVLRWRVHVELQQVVRRVVRADAARACRVQQSVG